MYVRVYVCMCVRVYVCTCLCVYVCMCEHVYVFMCMCVRVYEFMCLSMLPNSFFIQDVQKIFCLLSAQPYLYMSVQKGKFLKNNILIQYSVQVYRLLMYAYMCSSPVGLW